jgi:hypothetical protein
MADLKTRTRDAAAYEADFHAWTREQAARLRDLRPNSIDWENIAEEIESLGRSEKREIESRMGVLLVHLLKWAYQPERRKLGWKATIGEQRRKLARALDESPSLTADPGTVLAEEYELARTRAADETDLPEDTFPATCAFTIEQVLDPEFWPEAATP